jgi:hypothetical protein
MVTDLSWLIGLFVFFLLFSNFRFRGSFHFFSCSLVLLAMRSCEYLRASLSGKFAQLKKDSEGRVIVPIENYSPQVFQLLLDYLYLGLFLFLAISPSSFLALPISLSLPPFGQAVLK